MFAYILRMHSDEQPSDEYFERFKATPGLLHAYDLKGVDDPTEMLVVAVWKDKAAADEYLNNAPLRREIDQTFPGVTRTMYQVLNSS